MTKPMRQQMPGVTAFIDDMRLHFGAADIDAQIRAGIRDGLPTFWARENGIEVGTKAPIPGVAFSSDEIVVVVPVRGGKQ